MVVERVVSGGQTGVDRAALDVALERNIPCGGWCPLGRVAEDGPIDDRYPLMETPSHKYAMRTRWNVRDSDGTLIVTFGTISAGTALTQRVADESGQPFYIADLEDGTRMDSVINWITDHDIRVLNIAGPRGSSGHDVYDRTVEFLTTLFERLADE